MQDGDRYQTVLFELPDGPAHWFYITSNGAVYKAGQTVHPWKRANQLNAQLKGHRMGVMIECHCPLAMGPGGRPQCRFEQLFALNFADERIEYSEQYWRSDRVDRQVLMIGRMPINKIWGIDGRSFQAWFSWVQTVEIRRRPPA